MLSIHQKPLASQMEQLQKEFAVYEETIEGLDGRWSKPGVQKDEEVEQQQAKVAETYLRFQEGLEVLAKRCKQSSGKGAVGDWEIPPENEETFFELTELNNRVTSLFIQLNNTIRTNYPVARIQQFEPRVSVLGSMADLIRSNKSIKPILEGPLAHLSHFRRVAGDGNCFYTSFTVRLLETIRQENAFEALIKHIYSDGIDNPSLKETVVGILSEIQEYPSQLEKVLADNNKILPLVRYFREVAAQEMLTHLDPEEYEIPFRITLIEDFNEDRAMELPFADLVRDYVQKMGVDATQVPMRALCHKLAFPVRIHSPQRYDKPIDALDGQEPRAEFIRLGLHYFIGYPKGQVIGGPAASPQPSMANSSEFNGKLEQLIEGIEALKASSPSAKRTQKLHDLFEQLNIAKDVKHGIYDEIGLKAGKSSGEQRDYGRAHFADSLSALQKILRDSIAASIAIQKPDVKESKESHSEKDSGGLIGKFEQLIPAIEALKASSPSPKRNQKLHDLFDQFNIDKEIKYAIYEEIGRKAGKSSDEQRDYGRAHFADSLSALQKIISEFMGA